MKKHKIGEDWIKLEAVKIFPSKEEEARGQFFSHPVDISIRDDMMIFIADNYLHKIIKLDAAGVFLGSIGGKGEGPGEFNFPNRIGLWKDELFVLEGQKPRIQVFDKYDRYVSSFAIFDNVNRFLVRDEIVYANCLYAEVNEKNKLIAVFDKSGRMTGSFGSRIDREGHWTVDSRVFLSRTKDEIIVLFEHYPIIRRYTADGALIKEIRIKSGIFDDLEKYNFNKGYTNPAPQILRLPRITAGVKAMGDRIYVLSHLPRLEIIELDLDGKTLATYYSEALNDVVNLAGFDVRLDPGTMTSGEKLVFYVLQSSEEARLYIFQTQVRKSREN